MSLWHPFTQLQGFVPHGRVAGASGAWLTLDDGRRLFDGISSWWVTLHGHCHPAIVRAIAEQAARFDQVILADYGHAPAEQLTERLTAALPEGLEQLFFSDDGSTAVEVALKMAWQLQQRADPGRTRIMAMGGGYHGDTLGAMSVTDRDVFTRPFHPLLLDVDFIPYGDGAAAEAWLEEHGAQTALCIVEPLIQGAEGMVFASPESLRRLAEACRKAGVLLIADEVMTGFGRTGTLFACEQAGVVPDLMCLSKGITGGALPLGATACTQRVFEGFLGPDKRSAFLHGHSYTGNPIACAAALASLELFEAEGTLEHIGKLEAVYRRGAAALAAIEGVSGVRVRGSILALEVGGGPGGYYDPIGRRVTDRALEEGLYLRPLGNTLYVLPPYCTTEAELGWVLEVLGRAIAGEMGELGGGAGP